MHLHAMELSVAQVVTHMKIAVYSTENNLSNLLADATGGVIERFGSELLLIRALRNRSFDLIVLDARLGYGRDHPIHAWRMANDCQAPVVLVGDFPDVSSIIAAFEADVADIVVGPVSRIELGGRILRICRRVESVARQDVIRAAGYVLDQRAMTVMHHNRPITLTPREFRLAWAFFSKPGVQLSRDSLGHSIWSNSGDIASRSLEQHIYKIRQKLRLEPKNGAIIKTVYAVGYTLELCETIAETQSDAESADTIDLESANGQALSMHASMVPGDLRKAA
jgi:DNA-binding response OmpR family regulator